MPLTPLVAAPIRDHKGRERKLFGLHSDDADLKHLYKLIGELEENPPKGDVSFMQVSALTPQGSTVTVLVRIRKGPSFT